MTSPDLVRGLRRRPGPVAAAALVTYGIVGALLVLLLALALAPAMGAFDALDRSSADVRETLTVTRDSLEGIGTSFGDARRSTERAAVTARSSASTARQLASGMSVSVFGVQPLAPLATSFAREGDQLDALAVELDDLGTALARNETDVGALRAQIGVLQTRASAFGTADVASRVPFAPVLYLLLGWLGLQAVGAVWLGVVLWRGAPRAAASGRTKHAA